MERTDRRYEVDWLRILLILSVFIFHIGMFFNTFGWHVKNNVQTTDLNALMSFLHIWRMPLLFFISGAGTCFALGNKSLGRYASERNRRLMIPFLFGIFTLVPIQVYLEKVDQYSSLLDFYTHMFEGTYPEGNMSWHHLWFILYLFFISMVAIPVISWLRSTNAASFFTFVDKLVSKKGGLLLLVIPILISQLILRPHFPNSTHGFVDDWAYMALYFIFFIYGFIFAKSKMFAQNLIKQRYINLIAAIVATVLLFSRNYISENDMWQNYSYLLTSILVAWFVGLAALGFSFKYLNFNSKFRKYANEAIYPFYLLHQPIILLIGFYMKDLEMSIALKAFYLTSLSLVASIGIYVFLIRPFNCMRIVFGLKARKKEQLQVKVIPTKS
ncbi:acyltransferase family protein [Marinifilum caeruleilacunae]|uniref:Acyltransferase n=1 Tax=Marinifilum caeruleilacunae TaxID=2499076 RepID=A0ABX1WYA4_9BACT|nr:acyltransferase family protein [Marinifilum caeruleilacunae]NOU61094.1 acyltransferase [Marinifilum caeruleilacunae]